MASAPYSSKTNYSVKNKVEAIIGLLEEAEQKNSEIRIKASFTVFSSAVKYVNERGTSNFDASQASQK